MLPQIIEMIEKGEDIDEDTKKNIMTGGDNTHFFMKPNPPESST